MRFLTPSTTNANISNNVNRQPKFVSPSNKAKSKTVSLYRNYLSNTRTRTLQANDTIMPLIRNKTVTKSKLKTSPGSSSTETPLFSEWFSTLSPEKQNAIAAYMFAFYSDEWPEARAAATIGPMILNGILKGGNKSQIEPIVADLKNRKATSTSTFTLPLPEKPPFCFDWHINTDIRTEFLPQFRSWILYSPTPSSTSTADQYPGLTDDERLTLSAYAFFHRAPDYPPKFPNQETMRDHREQFLNGLYARKPRMPRMPPIIGDVKVDDEQVQATESKCQERPNDSVVERVGGKGRLEQAQIDSSANPGEVDDYPNVSYPLPTPPAPGYRAKLTRNGTLILDDDGDVVWERIPGWAEERALGA
ncbi:hypothetical protein PM082_011986 [Marasmius tenuissimus]|nr:hypothetical protein PM082_011986 [Marasmius tenuissimus]